MGWIPGILTVALVLDCVFLILLILIQLPKKEAGLGQAFGASATDALFGAGSGTALTKMTKYATGVFLGITFLLAILNANANKARNKSFEDQMKQTKATAEETATAAAKRTPPPATNVATAPAGTGTTSLLLTSTTNAPAAATNTAPKPDAQKK